MSPARSELLQLHESSSELYESQMRRKAARRDGGGAAGMDVDRISRLPEHVKHHILSFIPSIREVVQTSSLSKPWLQTWRTFQISDFRFWMIVPSGVDPTHFVSDGWNGESERFVRFVDGALMRSRDGMPRFRLYATPQMAPHVDKWLGMALDNHVGELTVDVVNFFELPFADPRDRLLYSIPERVLSAEFIKSLTLSGSVKIGGISSVSLPSLRSLCLEKVDINDQMFHGLLGGCRLLEDLSVLGGCGSLSEMEVSNLNCLKRVTVAVPSLNAVSIRAPALESFSLDCVSFKPNLSASPRENGFNLLLPESPNLRSLELTGDCVTDEWFCRFLHEFHLLESLTVSRCSSWKRIWILNPLLKQIAIWNCDNLVGIRVDTPELSSFYCEADCSRGGIKLPSVWTEAPPNSCAVGFKFCFLEGPTAFWFEELQKFLPGWSTTFRCLESTIHLSEWEEEMDDKMNKELVTLSAPGTQHLKLQFMASGMDYSVILGGFLSICRPTTILLKATCPLLKFICELLANREENPESSDVKHWRQELKDVKIERVQGKVTQHRGPLDWSTLFSLLPTLSTWDEVCFKLQWGDV